MSNALRDYSRCQLTWLVSLRVAIGWHFLFEGFTKVTDYAWSAQAYLLDSQGLFADFFNKIAINPSALRAVNFMNMWGLLLIGLGLILGLFEKAAIWCGMTILALYYLSHPSFTGITFAFPMEGNYLIIDKNLVELIALGVLSVFPTSGILGIDRFFDFSKK
jgi:thiosulfate dehydrogenase (quinone) large subunit